MRRNFIGILSFWVFIITAIYFIASFGILHLSHPYFRFNETEQDSIESNFGIRQQLSAVLTTNEPLNINCVTISPVPFPEDDYRMVEDGVDTSTFFWGKLIRNTTFPRHSESLFIYFIAFQMIFYLGAVMLGLVMWWLYVFRPYGWGVIWLSC